MKNIIRLFVLIPSLASAGVYKWVDENGVTHFGSQKPRHKESEQIEIKEDTPRELVGASLEGMAEDDGDTEKIDCNKAVDNARYGISTMIDVGLKNYKDGRITKKDFNSATNALKSTRARISTSHCLNAKDDVKRFYKCTSNSYNHVFYCVKQYKLNKNR